MLEPLGSDPQATAATLSARITPAQARAWSTGDAASWARESYSVARTVAYTLGTPAGCGQDAAAVPLPPGYAERALGAAEVQLERAGVRLAVLLNRELGPCPPPPYRPGL